MLTTGPCGFPRCLWRFDSDCKQEDFFSLQLWLQAFYLWGSLRKLIFNAACQTFRIKSVSIDVTRYKPNKVFFVIGCCRFIARPCALGLKIQANGPQKAQHNAILEKVFTAITKVNTMFLTTVKGDLLLWEGKKKH